MGVEIAKRTAVTATSEAHGDRLYHVSMDARTIGLMEKLTPTTFGVYVFNRKPTRYHCAKAPL